MKLELKVAELHEQNLKNLSLLSFFSDELKMIKNLLASYKTKEKIMEEKKNCSELDTQIARLKKQMVKQDSKLLTFLSKGYMVPEDKLKEGLCSVDEVNKVSRQFQTLKARLSYIIRERDME
jgi:hypothetical protein